VTQSPHLPGAFYPVTSVPAFPTDGSVQSLGWGVAD
jgi:hypothetical protein